MAYACLESVDGGENNVLEFRYDYLYDEYEHYWDCSNTGKSDPEWSRYIEGVKTVIFNDSFKGAKLTSCYSWFDNGSSITSINNAENLNTEKVTTMNSMFRGCSNLTTPPNTGNWDTSEVTDMTAIFSGCSNLSTPPDTSNWNTSEVTNMLAMFNACSNLTSPPVTSN